ncbi:hypothetical protein G7013_02820 [Pseudomonas viridiflava]|uniref:hypothetical protein n=1 Tax=Pseudomonas viridiflava TaxID=33069 RepID=UPI0011C3A3E3|nr:hypothetical protein [Pseudomonas viridiflava]MBA1228582.1 hypothetical protein [Pseudomonas viridiflava]
MSNRAATVPPKVIQENQRVEASLTADHLSAAGQGVEPVLPRQQFVALKAGGDVQHNAHSVY